MKQVSVRPVRPDDSALLWKWRNAPRARASSIQTNPIAWDEHEQWLARKLSSADCRIWILESEGSPVGQARYDRIGNIVEVAITIAEEYQGQGLGTRLLQLSADLACATLTPRTLVAIVRAGNDASRHTFERAGFKETAALVREGQACLRLERSCAPSASESNA